MSQAPASIQGSATLSSAHGVMREHRIRHLPVLDGRRLIGIVSDRDLHLLESLRDVDPRVVRVEEAMTAEPFTVGPRTSLASVARSMAKAKFGSTIVVEGGRIVGIFTTTDALDTLAEILQPMSGGRTGARLRHPRRVLG